MYGLATLLRAIQQVLMSFTPVMKKLDEIQARLKAQEQALQSLQSGCAEMQEKLDALISFLIPQEAVEIRFVVTIGDKTFEYKQGDDAMVFPAGTKATATIKPVDAFGNAAVLDPENKPVWASSNPEVIKVNATTEDGLTAEVESTGVVGTAQVSVLGDAKFGPEVKEIVGLADIQVIAGEATVISIEFSTPA